MKTFIIYTGLFILMLLMSLTAFSQQPLTFKSLLKGKLSSSYEYKIGRITDSLGRAAFALYPNTNPAFPNNLTLLTDEGVMIIGENGPCQLMALNVSNPLHEARLFVLGAAYNREMMWSTPLGGSNLILQEVEMGVSMNVIRSINLYLDGIDGVQINPNEVRGVLPNSIREISYNGNIQTVFNGSELFYHFLGSIRYLDKEKEELEVALEMKQAEIDKLQNEVNELKTKNGQFFQHLNNMETRLSALEEIPSTSQKVGNMIAVPIAKITKIYPNPTGGVIQLEIELPENTQHTTLRLMDAKGKLLHEKSLHHSEQLVTLNLAQLNLPAGQYFCTLIVDGTKVHTQQIILMK